MFPLAYIKASSYTIRRTSDHLTSIIVKIHIEWSLQSCYPQSDVQTVNEFVPVCFQMSKLQHPYFPPCLKLGLVFAFPPLSEETVESLVIPANGLETILADTHCTSEDVPSASVDLNASSLPTCSLTCHSMTYIVLPDAHKSVFLQKPNKCTCSRCSFCHTREMLFLPLQAQYWDLR